MDKRRLWHSFRLLLIKSGIHRAIYLKKNNIFGEIGSDVMIQSRIIPLYPEKIFIGNNVRIASNVTFITHDVIHNMLNNLEINKRKNNVFHEKIGEIHIGNNVFIGANSIIMYDVNIGNNVIIGAGSLVNKDIPDNTVSVGRPCKVISSFDDFLNKKILEQKIK